jgi:hypothetical protein
MEAMQLGDMLLSHSHPALPHDLLNMHHGSMKRLLQHSFGFVNGGSLADDGIDDGCGTDGLAEGLREESVGLFDGAAEGLELATTEGLDDG